MADTAYCARHIYLVFIVFFEYLKTVINPLNLEARTTTLGYITLRNSHVP
jgi:hypothetical protein